MSEARKPRPKSVTLASMFIILNGLVGLLATPINVRSPESEAAMASINLPPGVQIGWIFAYTLVMITTGAAMLDGRKIGRTVFVAASVLTFLVFFIAASNKFLLLPGYAIAGLLITVLYRPEARRYFEDA